MLANRRWNCVFASARLLSPLRDKPGAEFRAAWRASSSISLELALTAASSATAPSTSTRSSKRSRTSWRLDRKSTRLNSSHLVISYPAFCLTKHTPSAIDSQDAPLTHAVAHADPGARASGALLTEHTEDGPVGLPDVRVHDVPPSSVTAPPL